MLDEMVSIILPTYNRASQLKSSMESVSNQTYSHFELIIVDDGSTDNTEEVVRSYQDERIRYCKLEKNGGQANARNYGINQAKYDYIAFEDSDDIWHRDKLEMQMQALIKAPKEVGFVYHKIRYEVEGGCIILPKESVELEKKSGDIYAQLLYDNLVPCPAILARRDCIEKADGFDVAMKSLEDYDFALKMAKHYEAIFIDDILLEASFSTTGVSGQFLNYLMASCYLVQKYKSDYLATDTLNHRIEIILRDARKVGMEEQFVKLLELSLQ